MVAPSPLLRFAPLAIAVLLVALAAQRVRTLEAEVARLRRFRGVAALEQHRSPPPAYVVDRHAAEQAALASGEHADSDAAKARLLASGHFPTGHDAAAWGEHVRAVTPAGFGSAAGLLACDVGGTVPKPGGGAVDATAAAALRDCGFVYLDSFFEPALVKMWHDAYRAFAANRSASRPFAYPVQGAGRTEHALPFMAPFNSSGLVDDPRLRRIVGAFLGGDRFKLELATVIDSEPGSADQRWHQDQASLWHPEERLPPHAVVVSVPLGDVSAEQGPTELCPGHKLRDYRGWTCDAGGGGGGGGQKRPAPVSAATTAGTALLWDYKLLHRGPGNRGSAPRAVLSLVFSKMAFVNVEAMVNRGISFEQTLNQRLWWEMSVWHPDSSGFFSV